MWRFEEKGEHPPQSLERWAHRIHARSCSTRRRLRTQDGLILRTAGSVGGFFISRACPRGHMFMYMYADIYIYIYIYICVQVLL